MKRVNLIISVEGKLWMMESMAAERHPSVIEIVDTVVSFNYKTRIAVGFGGVQYRVFIDHSVGICC